MQKNSLRSLRRKRRSSMQLIGLTGTLGAGKGTVTEYLTKEKGFTYVSVSQFLADEAVRWGREPDRMARHDVANHFRAQGPMALMEACFAAVPSDAERVVLEPQHTVGEVGFIHGKGGKVIGVDADLHLRYERIKKRGSEKDNVTFEEFKMHQELESKSDDPNEQNLAAAIEAAYVVIQNNGTLDELHTEIDRVLVALGISD
jgi:dephospho-CoA kinase